MFETLENNTVNSYELIISLDLIFILSIHRSLLLRTSFHKSLSPRFFLSVTIVFIDQAAASKKNATMKAPGRLSSAVSRRTAKMSVAMRPNAITTKSRGTRSMLGRSATKRQENGIEKTENGSTETGRCGGFIV